MLKLHRTSRNIIGGQMVRMEGDLRGSDHYPTITRLPRGNICSTGRPRWWLKTANWKSYREDVKEELKKIKEPDLEQITKSMQQAATNNIKMTKGNITKRKLKWITPEIRDLIRLRREQNENLKTTNPKRTSRNIGDLKG
jgi:hypothetical protein